MNSLGNQLQSVISSSESKDECPLFKPGAKNQVTFDALSISRDKVVTLFQATIQKNHSVKAKGLHFVWDALHSAGQKPLRHWKWRLVFVVPEDVEKHWKKVQPIDFGGKQPERKWDEHVEQFVWVLPKQ